MKKLIFFILTICIGLYITNSTSDITASEKYFKENQNAIQLLLNEYRTLQEKQNFTFGFLDDKYDDYMVQVVTDSVKYIYKKDVSQDQNFTELQNSPINKESLYKIAEKVIKAKAIWIKSEDIYLSGFKQKGTIISFKPERINMPFTPTKFTTLLILDKKEEIKLSNEELEKFGIHKIAPSVYQTISNQFR